MKSKKKPSIRDAVISQIEKTVNDATLAVSEQYGIRLSDPPEGYPPELYDVAEQLPDLTLTQLEIYHAQYTAFANYVNESVVKEDALRDEAERAVSRIKTELELEYQAEGELSQKAINTQVLSSDLYLETVGIHEYYKYRAKLLASHYTTLNKSVASISRVITSRTSEVGITHNVQGRGKSPSRKRIKKFG